MRAHKSSAPNRLATGVKNLISLSVVEKSNPRNEIDFHKYRKLAFFVSWAIVATGIASIYSNKDQILGIDFRGGGKYHLFQQDD